MSSSISVKDYEGCFLDYFCYVKQKASVIIDPMRWNDYFDDNVFRIR